MFLWGFWCKPPPLSPGCLTALAPAQRVKQHQQHKIITNRINTRSSSPRLPRLRHPGDARPRPGGRPRAGGSLGPRERQSTSPTTTTKTLKKDNNQQKTTTKDNIKQRKQRKQQTTKTTKENNRRQQQQQQQQQPKNIQTHL